MNYAKLKYALLGIVLIQISCKKFIELEPPKNSLVQETVFQNNDQATSAVTGIYATLATSSNYASGGPYSITCFAGVSSDELIGYHVTNIPFYENLLTPEFSNLLPFYSGPFKTVYTANAVLEGLATSTGVTPPIKEELKGEALFIRAFAYFYLVNLYGPVPLQLITDYHVTQSEARTPTAQIYEQILSDLKAAESLLPESYVTAGRVRPNKSAVQALLARTYLYQKDWENAEKYATLVLDKTSTYALADLDGVFLSNSKEAIWQLFPAANSNAQDGNLFILLATPAYVSLSSAFAQNVFEPGDKRQNSWVKSYTDNTGTYYYPYKYKIKSGTSPSEYSMVLRLAEQYLIRAEARINQPGKITSGIEDLNIIRTRSRLQPTESVPNPLPSLSAGLNKEVALLAVEQERRAELFSEWGHRWFDLKRTGRADAVLALLKHKWRSASVLYPIPSTESSRNHNLTQNDGY